MSNICLVFRPFISDVKLLTTIHQAIVASCQSIVYIPTMNYPIQVVVRETGLTAHVLRVWEKRYAAVVPERTATQRRTYSDADVHRLKLLRSATLLGHPIGSVAKLSDVELETLVQAAATQAQMPSAPSIGHGALIPNSPIIRDCIEAVKTFDADALTTLLERAAVQSGYTALLRQVIAPLAHR